MVNSNTTDTMNHFLNTFCTFHDNRRRKPKKGVQKRGTTGQSEKYLICFHGNNVVVLFFAR